MNSLALLIEALGDGGRVRTREDRKLRPQATLPGTGENEALGCGSLGLGGVISRRQKRQYGLCGPRAWEHSKVGLFVCFSAQESFPEKLILKAWS